MYERTLNTVCPGETVRIHALQSKSGIRRRLLDMGFTEGTPAACLYRSPAGDPTAYYVRGSIVALRQEDAKMILIRPK